MSYYLSPYLGVLLVDPFKISLAVVAALLTIVGFSINDTIVVFDRIREVRGMGLLIGTELKHKVQPYLQALMDRGVLALPAGMNVLRLLPPLVIEKADLDTAIDQIEFVLSNTKVREEKDA